ncbi:MAG: hypothetical protein VXW68_02480, partial [SAR324 cluster bacterium]|nr:hypothetical protein [SAR324 cluster bacterium]
MYVLTILSIDQVVCSNTKGFCLKTPEVASNETAIPRKVPRAIPMALLSIAGCKRLSKICHHWVLDIAMVSTTPKKAAMLLKIP